MTPLPPVLRAPAVARPSGRAVALLPLAAVLVALVGGGLVGLGVWAVTPHDATSRDGWADLVAVVVGMLVGAVAAAVLLAVGLTAVARRLLAPGRRLQPVLLALGLDLALAAVGIRALTSAADGAAPLAPAVAVLAGLLVLVVPSVVVVLAERRQV
ncbi:MAG TPA: hypothetical protein VGK35_13815 [Actinotalea sp.]|jgi:hypothetical protein